MTEAEREIRTDGDMVQWRIVPEVSWLKHPGDILWEKNLLI